MFKANRLLAIIVLFFFAVSMGSCGGGGGDSTLPSPPPPTQSFACSDKIDNDGDGLIDLNDPGCSSSSDNDEFNESPPPPPPPNVCPTGYTGVWPNCIPPPPPPPPSSGPTASLSYPEQNQLVGGTMTVEAKVSDDMGISKVELLIDDLVAATDASGKQGDYKIDFNADALITGTHALKVKATDTSGNINFSATIAIKVDPLELRKKALQFLLDFNAQGNPDGTISGEVKRWERMPIVVEVSPEILQDMSLEDVKKATGFWTKYTGILFEVRAGDVNTVNPMTGKQGVIYIQYGGLGISDDAAAEEWNNIKDYKIQASIIAIKKGWLSIPLLAHELGHALPIQGHPSNKTIMDTDGGFLKFRIDSITAKALKILYFELGPGYICPVP